jgi:anhydro-N-acetylmuramic acid kinase
MSDRFIGLISGTSMDGIDAVLVEFGDHAVTLVATHEHPYGEDLRARLSAAIRHPEHCTVDEVGSLDRAVGESFRDAANALLASSGIAPASVVAIGSHGQTLRHLPRAAQPFTLQIGDPSIIATGTGIRTVADFRRADLALGGEGAPLAPAFHEWLFRRPGRDRVVLNIGGIANVTMLAGNPAPTTGFDTGPGNTLLDAWVGRHRSLPFDRDGAWASSGTVDERLLGRLLADPYFHEPPPKSTGFEYFNLGWLERFPVDALAAVDVQATLAELTAASVDDAIHRTMPEAVEVLVCGGGAHNTDLIGRLRRRLAPASVTPTAAAGLGPDWVEAAAFAWLAMRRLEELPGNLPAVTGASRAAPLGAVFAAGPAVNT